MTYEDYYQALSASDFVTTAFSAICDQTKMVQYQRTLSSLSKKTLSS